MRQHGIMERKIEFLKSYKTSGLLDTDTKTHLKANSADR